jgi:hypothetical protein
MFFIAPLKKLLNPVAGIAIGAYMQRVMNVSNF